MKRIFKKISAVLAATACAASLTVAGTAVVWAEEEIDANVKEALIATAEGLTETIIPLSEEEIGAYIESGDEFTVSAMEAWEGSLEEVGEKSADQEKAGETEIVFADDQYTVTVPVLFEKADANFVYLFDEQGMPLSMTVDVQYPMSVTLQRAGLNTLMGLGTVFIMLIFLSFIIYLFKFVPMIFGGKKEEKKEAPAPAPVVVAPVQEETDDTELIAVISAAIAASEGTSTDGFVVRSIRKVNRKKR
ncbi:MAG: OadG family protein [Eubacteriales bacterium]|nr:OadG family protein [Eubacteriales bacterium]